MTVPITRPFDPDIYKTLIFEMFQTIDPNETKEWYDEVLEKGWACSLKPLNNPEFTKIYNEAISQPEFKTFMDQLKYLGFDADLYLKWLRKLLFETARCIS
jgi:hypothetical protein